jgi:hypothetical protein
MAMDQMDQMGRDQEVTVHLPASLRARLERLASLTGQPLEGLIVKTLSTSLPPLPDDLPLEAREALRALEDLDDSALAAVTGAMLSRHEIARVTALRERQREGSLTTSERAELDILLRAADLITLRKAYAAVLLKWRGHPLPSLSAANAPT